MMDKATLERLFELGSARPTINSPDAANGIPFVVLPKDTKLESLMPLMPLHHIKRTVLMDDIASFCDYVCNFKTPHTLISCQATAAGATFRAILDYHAAPDVDADDFTGIATFCDHVVTYTTASTPEWTTWMASNRKFMTQEEFAVFLEENSHLFRAPDGANLLELVTTLFARSNVSYDGAIRMRSGGVTLHYDETVEVKGNMVGRPGEFELPPVITAAVSPFIGAPLYQVDARLKYQLANRKLALRFETITPHIIIRDSIKLLIEKVKELTELTPLMGTV
jgi:uncharacterized protein YfdQ (DUF2303 family)